MESSRYTSTLVDINGLKMHYQFREGNGMPMVFFHATGFHSAVWYQVVKDLDNPIYLIDAPGHGKSDRPGHEFYWDRAADSMAELLSHLDLTRIMGVGHSMGGQLMLSVASRMQDRFEQLLLLDPVVVPKAMIQMFQSVKDSPIAKRRNDFGSNEEFYNTYLDRDPYNTWDKTVFRDYSDSALKKVEATDRFQLACEPDLEACVYRNLGVEPLLGKLSEINVSTHIIRAREFGPGDKMFSFRHSPTRPDLVSKLPNATESYRQDVDHFFPMEFPNMVLDEILRLEAQCLSEA